MYKRDYNDSKRIRIYLDDAITKIGHLKVSLSDLLKTKTIRKLYRRTPPLIGGT